MLLVMFLVMVLGCAPGNDTDVAGAITDAPELLVVRTLSIAVADEASISPGFNLDGETTIEGISKEVQDYYKDLYQEEK